MGDGAYTQAMATSDPFLCGACSESMMALGYVACFGMFYPDPAGTIILYRRQVYPGEVGDWAIVGLAHPDAATISNWAGAPHAAPGGYEYAVARALGNGFVSELSMPLRIDIDSEGAIITDLPSWPRDVDVVPIDGGKYRIRWTYTDFGQAGAPTDFAIFEGTTPATIDYDTPIGTASFVAGRSEYFYETGAYGDQTEHAFAVRARNATADAELNEYTTDVVKAEAATPASATIVSAAVWGAGG
jgi:hypothetical protein